MEGTVWGKAESSPVDVWGKWKWTDGSGIGKGDHGGHSGGFEVDHFGVVVMGLGVGCG